MSSNVVNIETLDWTPEQATRWLESEVSQGDVTRVYIVLERTDESITHCWSKATCEQLWYMIGWVRHKLSSKYFGGERA